MLLSLYEYAVSHILSCYDRLPNNVHHPSDDESLEMDTNSLSPIHVRLLCARNPYFHVKHFYNRTAIIYLFYVNRLCYRWRELCYTPPANYSKAFSLLCQRPALTGLLEDKGAMKLPAFTNTFVFVFVFLFVFVNAGGHTKCKIETRDGSFFFQFDSSESFLLF